VKLSGTALQNSTLSHDAKRTSDIDYCYRSKQIREQRKYVEKELQGRYVKIMFALKTKY